MRQVLSNCKDKGRILEHNQIESGVHSCENLFLASLRVYGNGVFSMISFSRKGDPLFEVPSLVQLFKNLFLKLSFPQRSTEYSNLELHYIIQRSIQCEISGKATPPAFSFSTVVKLLYRLRPSTVVKCEPS